MGKKPVVGAGQGKNLVSTENPILDFFRCQFNKNQNKTNKIQNKTNKSQTKKKPNKNTKTAKKLIKQTKNPIQAPKKTPKNNKKSTAKPKNHNQKAPQYQSPCKNIFIHFILKSSLSYKLLKLNSIPL